MNICNILTGNEDCIIGILPSEKEKIINKIKKKQKESCRFACQNQLEKCGLMKKKGK
ncbi:hypothetical protein AAK894_04420 [Lachnospiraceae bacterium 46-61]